MREIPQATPKLKALQDAMEAQEERKRISQEKITKSSKAINTSVVPPRQGYVPTIEDEYLIAQFQNGRYCGD